MLLRHRRKLLRELDAVRAERDEARSAVTSNVTVSATEVPVIEFWCGTKKLTLYLHGQVEFVQVWGPDTASEMDDGGLVCGSDILGLWTWLTTAEPSKPATEDR